MVKYLTTLQWKALHCKEVQSRVMDERLDQGSAVECTTAQCYAGKYICIRAYLVTICTALKQTEVHSLLYLNHRIGQKIQCLPYVGFS